MRIKEKKITDNLPAVILDLQYLPSVPYFLILNMSDRILFDIHEHFIKQTYRNRCRILTANGVEDLVIPVKKPHQHKPVAEIKIDHSQKWAIRHWRAIQSAYGKSPWFFHYADEFRKIILGRYESLYELNYTLINLCLKIMGSKAQPGFIDRYEKEWEENYTDFRSVIHPKRDAGSLPFFQPVPYVQNFGLKFADSLSIIDLIFSEGPRTLEVISLSKRF
jgi:hypothetical protein